MSNPEKPSTSRVDAESYIRQQSTIDTSDENDSVLWIGAFLCGGTHPEHAESRLRESIRDLLPIVEGYHSSRIAGIAEKVEGLRKHSREECPPLTKLDEFVDGHAGGWNAALDAVLALLKEED